MNSLCSDYGKAFATVNLLNIHKINHDKDDIKCEVCDVICIGKKKFLNHMKIHQTFECLNCNETVKLNSKSSHMKKCHEKEFFQCDECPYESNRMDNLNTHKVKCHKDKMPEVKYSCNFACPNEKHRNSQPAATRPLYTLFRSRVLGLPRCYS